MLSWILPHRVRVRHEGPRGFIPHPRVRLREVALASHIDHARAKRCRAEGCLRCRREERRRERTTHPPKVDAPLLLGRHPASIEARALGAVVETLKAKDRYDGAGLELAHLRRAMARLGLVACQRRGVWCNTTTTATASRTMDKLGQIISGL